MPEISILMPVYNGEAYLAAAVKSVQQQTFSDWELLIVNDGSTDHSGEIMEGFARTDSRVKLFFRQENKGLVYSLNEGLAGASGEYIARLDSDDEWSGSSKLERQRDFLRKHSKVGLLGTWARAVDANGRFKRELKYPITDSQIRKEFLVHNCFVHSSIVAPRGLMLECGGYNEADAYVEDYGLWLKIGLRAELCNLPEIMVNYRVNPVGITNSRHKAQVAGAAKLVSGYKNQYPNYGLARAKWAVQKFF